MSLYIIILSVIGLFLLLIAFKTKKKYLYYVAGIVLLAVVVFVVALGFALDTM